MHVVEIQPSARVNKQTKQTSRGECTCVGALLVLLRYFDSLTCLRLGWVALLSVVYQITHRFALKVFSGISAELLRGFFLLVNKELKVVIVKKLMINDH